MSDIFNEVDEDLRRDKAQQLWNKYGNYVLVVAVLIVAGTAGYVFWRDYERKQAEAGALQYLAAVDQAHNNGEAAEQALGAVIRDGRKGYAVLAKFQDAALKARKGDAAAAAATYWSIATDSGADQALRDAATLLALLNAPDSGNAADRDRALAALSASGSPWRHLAWEIAAISDIAAGRAEQARTHYTRIADDPDAPPGVRARAAEMIAALGNS